GNSSPAGPFDVTGNAFIRGTLQLPSVGTSTASTGYNSQPLDFLASSFASNDGTPIVQHFRWQAEPVSNNTSSPSGKINLLYGPGVDIPAETGLSIASTGVITFAPGQTFPSSAGVTSVSTGSGLLVNGGAGPATGADALTVNTAVIATNTSVTTAVSGGVTTAETFATNAAGTAQSNAETYAASNFLPLTGGTLSGTLNAATVNSTNPYQIGGTNVLTVDGLNNVFVGSPEPATNTGSANTASGVQALYSNTSGYGNTATGFQTLYLNSTGEYNTATGDGALIFDTAGSYNTASGAGALDGITTGNSNTASGYLAGADLVSGSSNITLGFKAGLNFNGAESNNIDIGNNGVAGESGVIRIGGSSQASAYIAGINGVTTGGSATGVVIDGNGNLGTISSSRRYKEDIHDMGAASDGLLRLRPVTFRYKKPYSDGSKPIQYGLIAEEVAEVYPDLVVRNKDGQIETVQYYKLDAMLLNEIQKLSKTNAADQAEMQRLATANAADQAEIANLRKEAQEQQAAIKQLLVQVQSIQQTVARGRSGRPRARVATTAAKKTTKSEVKHLSGETVTSLAASGK
ncbi:MAG: tail fiber domain-containing protein, partial [Candidatus Acidiferrales bacterium]